jgi:hypothetical protein
MGPPRSVGIATDAVPVFHFKKRDRGALSPAILVELIDFPTMFRASIQQTGDDSLVTQQFK